VGGGVQSVTRRGILSRYTAQSARNHGPVAVLKSKVVPRSSSKKHAPKTLLAGAGLLGCLIVAALALMPGSASSAAPKATVLGQTQTTPKAACPTSPCEAVGKVSGFQTRAGTIANPFVVPYNGKIVAWGMSLSKPKESQQSFFNNFYGSTPQARLGVVSQVPDKDPPRYELLRQSPIVVLTPYLGRTVTFALDQPLTVKKGDIISLTIPTWAPAFAVGLDDSSGWRASRKAGACTKTDDIKQSRPQQKVGSNKQYGCFYKTARLLYTATVVKG
jgi:hypothetical protein